QRTPAPRAHPPRSRRTRCAPRGPAAPGRRSVRAAQQLRKLPFGSSGTRQDRRLVNIPETVEASIEIGVSVPLGLDVLLGPGRLFGEAQLLDAATGQRSTGL